MSFEGSLYSEEEEESAPLIGLNWRRNGPPLGIRQDNFNQSKSWVSSILSLINLNLFGALIILPYLITTGGYLIPITLIILLYMSTSHCSVMLTESWRLMQGNREQNRPHSTSLAKLMQFYFTNRVMVSMLSWLFLFSLWSTGIILILLSIDIIDLCLQTYISHTYALVLYPAVNFLPTTITELLQIKFTAISIGFIAVFLFTLLSCRVKFFKSIVLNIVFFAVACASCVLLFWFFLQAPVDFSSLEIFGSNHAQILGICIFLFGNVLLIPQWASKRKPEVTSNIVIWITGFFKVSLFLIFGVLGALVILSFSLASVPNIFSTLFVNKDITLPTQIGVILGLSLILFGIPGIFNVIRRHLISEGICNRTLAWFWAFIFPWIIVFPFTYASNLISLINWTALCTTGIINFIIPPLIWIKALKRSEIHEENFNLSYRIANDIRAKHKVEIPKLLSTCSSSTIEERKIEKKTLSEEEFLEIYNGEGNHSAWQSAQIVFGKYVSSIHSGKKMAKFITYSFTFALVSCVYWNLYQWVDVTFS